jgi:5'-nucleotidase / UDP-sugar diphosphatase
MKKWSTRLTSLLLAALLLVQLGAAAAAAEESGVRITIVHVNDVHSRVEGTDSTIGYAKLATILKEKKAANPNTLLLDAGDTLHGQTIANLEQGASIVRLMNAVGFDAMASGNHDYNYGQERLVELAGQADFPILAANVYKSDGTRLLKPYIVKELSGVKVAIFGLATPETLYKTHPNNVKGLTFADPAEEAKKMVAELEGKADVIIALAHLGVDASSKDTSTKVAQQVPGIDVIIDGHSHTALDKGLTENGVLIAQSGEYSENIGVVELTASAGEVKSKSASLIPLAQTLNVAEDPAVLSILNGVKKEQESLLSEIVGKTSVPLDGEREQVRVGETNLGNLITDAMLAESGADIALTNGGGIRASIPAGDITKGQVITVLPFGNYIQTKQVTGSDIKAALEHGVSAYPESLGGFPHVAGMTFKFDPQQPVGQRVYEIVIRNEPIDLEASYMLATNDFLAAGGDAYAMFKDQPIANDFASLEEAVMQYLEEHGNIAPKAEGRILAAPNPDAASAEPERQEQPQEESPVPAPEPNPIPAPAEPTPKPMPAPDRTDADETPDFIIVKKGDTLWAISRKHGTTWQQLAKLNKLRNPDLIFPGQKIMLP